MKNILEERHKQRLRRRRARIIAGIWKVLAMVICIGLGGGLLLNDLEAGFLFAGVFGLLTIAIFTCIWNAAPANLEIQRDGAPDEEANGYELHSLQQQQSWHGDTTYVVMRNPDIDLNGQLDGDIQDGVAVVDQP